jgi:hypothetical protein
MDACLSTRGLGKQGRPACQSKSPASRGRVLPPCPGNRNHPAATATVESFLRCGDLAAAIELCRHRFLHALRQAKLEKLDRCKQALTRRSGFVHSQGMKVHRMHPEPAASRWKTMLSTFLGVNFPHPGFTPRPLFFRDAGQALAPDSTIREARMDPRFPLSSAGKASLAPPPP